MVMFGVCVQRGCKEYSLWLLLKKKVYFLSLFVRRFVVSGFSLLYVDGVPRGASMLRFDGGTRLGSRSQASLLLPRYRPGQCGFYRGLSDTGLPTPFLPFSFCFPFSLISSASSSSFCSSSLPFPAIVSFSYLLSLSCTLRLYPDVPFLRVFSASFLTPTSALLSASCRVAASPSPPPLPTLPP